VVLSRERSDSWWLRISPDGSKVAVYRTDAGGRAPDIWVYDIARGSGRRLTFDPSPGRFPV
jgi:Tol biopolymer transport system component